MTEILHQASDDFVALAICAGAVLLCGGIMYFSHHIGRLKEGVRLHQPAADEPGLPAPAASEMSRAAPPARERAA